MQLPLHSYIDGEWRIGKQGARSLLEPATEEVLAIVTEASSDQVDLAVQAARAAFEHSDWAMNTSLRIELIHKLADYLEKETEAFAVIESRNTGKPIKESRLDIADAVLCLRYYAELVESRTSWKKEMFDGSVSKVTQEPLGVCALIVPWNFPLLLGIWKLAPALAAGNTVVFKPSEVTPLSFLELARAMQEIGFPAGVFHLVLGDGATAGATLVSHPQVDKVSFTGGTKTGTRIYMECARLLKRVSLELGGKSPLLVFADADIEIAVDWALFGAFFNQGQVCVASSRVLVHADIAEAFLDRLCTRAQHLRLGNPLDESTEMGPLVSHAHLQKVDAAIHAGVLEGATLRSGGRRLDGPGYFMTPAVFTDVTQEMKLVQEEIFGPVVTVQSFTTEEEALSLANGTPFGLAAGVLSSDLELAERVASQLRAGMVWINGYHTAHVETAWGGFKQSGIGRELGPYGLAAFTEPKHTNLTAKLQHVGWYQTR